MSLLIVIPNRNTQALQEKLSEALPNEVIEVWPDIKQAEQVEFVLAWLPPEEIWQHLPNLKGISSFGAGVDGLISPALPDVPIARIVDPNLAFDMGQYVLGHILAWKLRIMQYRQQQSVHQWYPKRAHRAMRVGILGFGQLGQEAARQLRLNGFSVSAWSRSVKQAGDIDVYSGEDGLYEMAEKSDYVVCLLPLTEQTEGVLNRRLFAAMPEHAVLINVGRGKHLVEADLLEALHEKQIAHAILDVFHTEPLTEDHPFWQQKSLTITPHVSALTDINTVVEQIAHNYMRVKNSEPMSNCIDAKKGY